MAAFNFTSESPLWLPSNISTEELEIQTKGISTLQWETNTSSAFTSVITDKIGINSTNTQTEGYSTDITTDDVVTTSAPTTALTTSLLESLASDKHIGLDNFVTGWTTEGESSTLSLNASEVLRVFDQKVNSLSNDYSQAITEAVTKTLGESHDDSYPGEDEFTGLHSILGGDMAENSPNLSPLGLVVIIALTLIGNIIVCLAVKIDKRLHHMTYFFFVSMSTLHIAMAAVVMPAATIVVVTGEFTYSEELCKAWVTLDFFFCNCTCLHLAFVNMDTFLRLKDPLRHGRVTTKCSLVLWIGAPWSISIVQSIAQFMLSQGDRGILENGICFISDKNFVILGLMFSFVIPSIISVTFYGLCANELRKLKAGKFLEDTEATMHNAFQYGSMESIPDNISESTNCLSDVGEDDEEMDNQHVHLAVVDRMKCVDMPTTEIKNSPALARSSNVETSFCNELYSHDGKTRETDEQGNNCIDNPAYKGHVNGSFALQEQVGQGGEQAALSCALLLQDSANDPDNGLLSGQVRPNAEHDHSSPDAALREEVAISRLMFLLLLLSIALWIPYSVSNLVYAICQHCTENMSFVTTMAFKWIAYCCGLLGPWIYVKFSEPLRGAIWIMFCCKYCNWDD